MDGIRRRPVERLIPSPPAGPTARVRGALALTRRELTFLGGGVGAMVLSWVTTLTWLC